MPVPSTVALDDIIVMDNVRTEYDDASIAELAESILSVGVLQPLGVCESEVIAKKGKKKGDIEYAIVFGHRRHRALLHLKSKRKIKGDYQVPVVERRLSPDMPEFVVTQLIENLQREDISVLDEARGFLKLIDQHGYNQRDLAAAIGRSPGHVAKRLALLTLPDELLPLIGGTLTIEEAYELSQLDDDQIKKLTKNVVNGGRGNPLHYDLMAAKQTKARRVEAARFAKLLDKLMIEPVKALPDDVDRDLFEHLGWFDAARLKKHTLRKNHIVVAGSAPMTDVHIYRRMTPAQLEKQREKERAEHEEQRQLLEQRTDERRAEYAKYIETEGDPYEKWEHQVDLERDRYHEQMAAYNESIQAGFGSMLLDSTPKDIGKMVLALAAEEVMTMRHTQRICEVLGLDVPAEDADGNELRNYDRPWRDVLFNWIGDSTTRALTAWVAYSARPDSIRDLEVFTSFRSVLSDQGVEAPAPLDLEQFGPKPWYDDATDEWRTDDPDSEAETADAA